MNSFFSGNPNLLINFCIIQWVECRDLGYQIFLFVFVCIEGCCSGRRRRRRARGGGGWRGRSS
jgi:hypothetical protein